MRDEIGRQMDFVATKTKTVNSLSEEARRDEKIVKNITEIQRLQQR